MGIPYLLLTTANKADSAYVCGSKKGYSIHWIFKNPILSYFANTVLVIF